MVRGQMVSFDEIKGYGFAQPDSGGDDVFVHVNDLVSGKHDLCPGARVEFDIEDGERGPKASNVTLLDESRPQPGGRERDADHGRGAGLPQATRAELTELLLREVPSLTGEPIVRVREVLAAVLRGHG